MTFSNHMNHDIVETLVFLALSRAREALGEPVGQAGDSSDGVDEADDLPGICTPRMPSRS